MNEKTVNPRIAWPHEAKHFTPWLVENLRLLNPVLGLHLTPLKLEQAAGKFRADIVLQDTVSGKKVLVEAQMEKSDHSHLGQCLTYAACIGIDTVIWIAASFSSEHIKAIELINARNFLAAYAVAFSFHQADTFFTPKFDVLCRPADEIWTKEAAKARLQMNAYLQQALYIEPRLREIIDAAVAQENEIGYGRIDTYYALKKQAFHLVGWHAVNTLLRTEEHFSAVIQAIYDLLPADDMELYPEIGDMPLDRLHAWEEWETQQG